MTSNPGLTVEACASGSLMEKKGKKWIRPAKPFKKMGTGKKICHKKARGHQKTRTPQ